INGCLTRVESSDLVDGKFIFPPEVDRVATYAFSPCGNELVSVDIPENVTSLGTNVFANCTKLKSVKLPTTLKRLPESAFQNCKSLEEIILPDSINFIGASAFASCSSLKSINIPEDIKEIYFSTFKNCTSLTDIKLGNNITTIYPNAFDNCTSLTDIKLPDKLTLISVNAFFNCTSLKNINLPENLCSIYSSAFFNCSSLEHISFPPSLKEINDYVFEGCSSLKTVSIPSSISVMGEQVFKDCSSLNLVEINNNLISAGEFSNCSALQNVIVNNPLTKIGDYAFENCPSLETVKLNNEVKSIGKFAFDNCKSIKSMSLPEGLTLINTGAFNGCESLESINLPSTIQEIKENSFTNCDSLEYLHIPDSTTSMKPLKTNSLLFFDKTEDGFNLSASQTSNSIPTQKLNIDYCFLSKHWKYKDILLKEQNNPKIADFYNRFVSKLPSETAEKFIENHNFTFFKQLKFENPFIKKENYYKILYNLGAFEPPYINEKGKKVDIAQKVVGFIQEKVDINKLNSSLMNMEIKGYKPDFTEFFINNYLSPEMQNAEKNHFGFLSKCYNQFEEVQKTNTSNRGSQRQLNPTIQKFESYFASEKYKGVTPENNAIAQTISPYFSSQVTFNNAVEIDKQRKKRKISNNILKKPLKEADAFENIDQYTEKVIESKSNILGNLTNIADNEFTFEWLEKNDPQNFILGKLCSCCAHLEGAGFGIMHASIVHPNIQNLVIRHKNGQIIAKSTLYINKLGRYGVCNNVEVRDGIYISDLEQIYQKFILGIREFATRYNKEHPLLPLRQINVGGEHNDLLDEISKHRKSAKVKLKAINYGKYGYKDLNYDGDSYNSQYVVWTNTEDKKIMSTNSENTNEVVSEKQ
ncbi:MAG: leucine-rich repeat domain-containing protein, partial [Clostridia bacterium]|nr:leucine-rich repeat domain-containing protein [Clostridia bacterium]